MINIEEITNESTSSQIILFQLCDYLFGCQDNYKTLNDILKTFYTL